MGEFDIRISAHLAKHGSGLDRLIADAIEFAEQAQTDGLPHLGALCLFMFATAARVGEACRLHWEDVDLSKGTATIYLFKPTPWQREAHLPPDQRVGFIDKGHKAGDTCDTPVPLNWKD